jgi:hypothetical protein
MPRSIFVIIIFCWFAFYLQSCDLFDSISKNEELPPATQEGKNTFGCYVNGKLWLPKGSNGTSNLDASYDPTFENGAFELNAYRIRDDVDQFIALGGKNVNKVGSYIFSQDLDSPGALLNDKKTKCSYSEQPNVIFGNFTVSKLDIANQIISGTFEFTLAKTGCDTIKVTDGRFDMKF